MSSNLKKYVKMALIRPDKFYTDYHSANIAFFVKREARQRSRVEVRGVFAGLFEKRAYFINPRSAVSEAEGKTKNGKIDRKI